MHVIHLHFFHRQTFRGTPYAVLITCLAVTDTLRLWIGLPAQWSKFFFRFNPMHKYFIMCKLHSYGETVLNCTSAWILIIITLFRAVSIWKPHKAKLICTPTRAIVLVVMALVMHVTCFLYIPLKWLEWVVRSKVRGISGTRCFANVNVSYGQYHAMQWYQYIAASFMPFLCLIVGNIYIIAKVTFRKIQRQELTPSISDTNRQTQRDHSMTVILILISLLFLITTSPFLITKLFELKTAGFLKGKSQIYLARYMIWRSTALMFNYVNNIANVFCYWASGELFRKELKAMLQCTK